MRVAESRGRVDEWGLVLSAAGIECWVRHRVDGWALIVASGDVAAAVEALDAYDRESPGDAAGVRRGSEAARSSVVVGVVVALALVWFFAMAGARGDRSAWFERGSADAERMVAGEWWRAVTALTLHADASHLLTNAVAATVLVAALCRQTGPGVGLVLLLLAGAGGNVLTALVHQAGHVSVGASTAIFGAVGALAGLRIAGAGSEGSRSRKRWVVVAAGLALLALLGTGPDADLLAHLFGLLTGGALAFVVGLTFRPTPPTWLDWPLTLATTATLAGAWLLAFR